MTDRPPRLPPGRTPWDAANGLRVGGLIGALLGVLATAVTDIGNAWLVFVGGALGSAIGYWSEKRHSHRGHRR